MEVPAEHIEYQDGDAPSADFDSGPEMDDEGTNAEGDDSMMNDSESDSVLSGEGGVPIASRRSISPSELSALIPADSPSTPFSTAATSSENKALLSPQRPNPYIQDAGNLLITDPNPLPQISTANIETVLTSNARDAAQSLLNHLLGTCPIHKTFGAGASTSGVSMTLPTPLFVLPREKKIPQPKTPTKWEQFAARKGIRKNSKGSRLDANGELRSTEGNMVYDESKGDWVPRHGYKGRNRRDEGSWLVEVDEKKEAETGKAGDARIETRALRREKMRRNERAQRANEKRARRLKA